MSHPTEPFETQNFADDDGPVIDSFFIATSNPPPIEDAQEPIVIPAETPVPRHTRIFSKEVVLEPTWDAVLLLPADHTRKSLNVWVYSPTESETDGIRLCDEKGSILSTAGKLLHGGNMNLAGHTGALYALPVGNASGLASAAIAVQYWGVSL